VTAATAAGRALAAALAAAIVAAERRHELRPDRTPAADLTRETGIRQKSGRISAEKIETKKIKIKSGFV
jgi:hypothetical protein